MDLMDGMDKGKEGCIVLVINVPDISDMENEFMKRGYLLPDGCKDLADALKLKQKHSSSAKPFIAKSGSPLEAFEAFLSDKEPQHPLLHPSATKILKKLLKGQGKSLSASLYSEAFKKWTESKPSILKELFKKAFEAAPKPPIKGELMLPKQISIIKLAPMIGQKPRQIIADLTKLGIFLPLNEELDFEIMSKIARMYGFLAKRAK